MEAGRQREALIQAPWPTWGVRGCGGSEAAERWLSVLRAWYPSRACDSCPDSGPVGPGEGLTPTAGRGQSCSLDPKAASAAYTLCGLPGCKVFWADVGSVMFRSHTLERYTWVAELVAGSQVSPNNESRRHKIFMIHDS